MTHFQNNLNLSKKILGLIRLPIENVKQIVIATSYLSYPVEINLD